MISIMKKHKYILTLCLVGLFASCNLDMNENPDASNKTTIREVMPVVLYYGAHLNYDHAEYGTFLSQALTTAGRSQTGALAYKSGWYFSSMNRHPQWRRHYYDIGENARVMIEMAQEQGAHNYELIGETVVLMSTLFTTDAFGPMPRTEAYKVIAPKYDSQEEIYDYMISKVDELIAKYEDAEYTNAPGNQTITAKQDRVFAGDLDKWKRFTYALKARIYLRKLPNWDPSLGVCNTIIAAVDSAMVNGGWQEPLYQFNGGVNEANCPWGPAQPTINSWESRKNELDGAILSKYFGEEILGVNRTPTNTEMDPRAESIMKKRTGPTSTSDTGAKYRYLDNNIGMEAAYTAKNYPDFYSREDGSATVFTANNSYLPYMLTEELLLIKAEALYWAGQKKDAYDVTKEAVIKNMNRHGITSASKINNYLRKAHFMPEATFNIGHLMRQKYICMFLQPEQWTDMRRYNYSNSTNGVLYDGVPIYPGLRRPYNLYEAHWSDNKNAWVERINYDPETEEKYNMKELVRLDAYKNHLWLRKKMIWSVQK